MESSQLDPNVDSKSMEKKRLKELIKKMAERRNASYLLRT